MHVAIAHLIEAEAALRQASEQARDAGDPMASLRYSEWAARVNGFRRYIQGSEAEMAARWAEYQEGI